VKGLVRWGILFLMIFGLTRPCLAGQGEDVHALIEQTLAMFKEKGQKATISAINDPKGPFRKGDIYVFAITMDNQLVGHHDHTIRGIKFNDFRDANGLLLFRVFKDVVETKGSGWVEYVWAKPGADKPSRKRSFVTRVPGEDLYVGAGFYEE
jgi:cytochrome c